MKKTKSNRAQLGFLSLLFILSFGFQPLFTSNQNTKFLHGIAASGFGELQRDWMVNTVDPLPYFSKLIQWIFEFGNSEIIYVLQLLLLFIFVYFSLLLIYKIFNLNIKSLVYATTLISLLFSPVIFEDLYFGFSEQFLFTQYLQPSSFAVLYLPAIYYFYVKKYYLSAFLLGIPGLLHAAYTLVGAVLFLVCFSFLFFRERKITIIILAGIIFSVVMLPAVYSQISLLSATSKDLTQKAMYIISEYRIPHHTDVMSVFRFDSIIKMSIISLAIWKVKNGFVRWLLIGTTIFLIITVVYGLINSNSIVAVSSPWRFSVIVVPLGMVFLIGYMSKYLEKFRQKSIPIVAISILILLAISGLNWTHNEFNSYQKNPGMVALNFIKKNPNEFKNSLFMVESKADYSDKFRLTTGLPIFINWKTHPYKDFEVIEWYEKLKQNDAFYAHDMTKKEMMQFLQKNKITHVLSPLDFALEGQIIFQNTAVKIIAIKYDQN